MTALERVVVAYETHLLWIPEIQRSHPQALPQALQSLGALATALTAALKNERVEGE